MTQSETLGATLWRTLRLAWRNAAEAPSDPRLAEDAGMRPAPRPIHLSPMVAAWLR